MKTRNYMASVLLARSIARQRQASIQLPCGHFYVES